MKMPLWKRIGAPRAARYREHRLRAIVGGYPAGRHHLQSAQAECASSARRVSSTAPRQARVDDGEADQPVLVAARPARPDTRWRARARRRRASCSRRRGTARAGRRRRRRASSKRAQHVVGALAPRAVQVRVDQHRRTLARSPHACSFAASLPAEGARAPWGGPAALTRSSPRHASSSGAAPLPPPSCRR